MTAATKREIRSRFKAMREGKPFDAAADHADRLVALLTPAAQSDPAPASKAYAQYVHAAFSDRFLSLCSAYPVRGRRP